MKKLFYIVPVITAFLLIMIFSQCKKETDCKVRVISRFSETGIDTGARVPGSFVKLGKPDFAEFAQAEGYSNSSGEFETTFRYEALLEINAKATIFDTIFSGIDTTLIPIDYVARGEVKLVPGETVEKTVLLIRQ